MTPVPWALGWRQLVWVCRNVGPPGGAGPGGGRRAVPGHAPCLGDIVWVWVNFSPCLL